MANSQAPTSVSACPVDPSTSLKPKNARMPHNIARALGGTLLSALLAACATGFGTHESEPRPPRPVVDKNAASVAVLTEDLQLLQKLVQAPPAEQAEITSATQRDYETAPTPSRQLRFALVLANPGHPASVLSCVQRLLCVLLVFLV